MSKNANKTPKQASSVSGSTKKSPFSRVFWLIFIPAFIAFTLVFTPNFWWHIIILGDFFLAPYGWTAFDSIYVQKYHRFLVDRLPDREELPAREVPLAEATLERLMKDTDGFTIPVIIRGAVKGAEALDKWTDINWWKEQYGDEQVMCKSVGGHSNVTCTVDTAFDDRTYISGESKLFKRRPELEAMVNTEYLDNLKIGNKVFTQIFMGFPKMGSDIHAAIGCNIFRQIAGRKKWWLIPTTQTAFVYSSLNQNGFSSHTKTNVGKEDEMESDWMKKLERYTVELDPGDVLINTAWYWHGILNLGEDPDELIIGVPTRYKLPTPWNSLRSNWLLSIIAAIQIHRDFGLDKFVSDTENLQGGIEKARTKRGEQMSAGKDAA